MARNELTVRRQNVAWIDNCLWRTAAPGARHKRRMLLLDSSYSETRKHIERVPAVVAGSEAKDEMALRDKTPVLSIDAQDSRPFDAVQ